MTTPYQRGNRDGLLNLAAEIERLAALCDESAEAFRARADRGCASAKMLYEHDIRAAEGYRKVAALARRRAEALPEDPEEPAP